MSTEQPGDAYQAWADEFNSGKSWRQIGAEAGLHESTIRRHAGHLARRRRTGPRRRDISHDDVLDLHKQGMGQRRIAAALDCSVQLVRLRLSELGLCAPADQRPRRGTGGAGDAVPNRPNPAR